MKIHVFVLIALFILAAAGCNSKKKAAEVAGYTYTQRDSLTTKSSLKIPGDWVKEDTECYGLLVSVDKEGKQITGKPIKAKIVKISESEIKMKALESVSLAEVKGCTKMGLLKGDYWIEKDGDLFQTRDEAINFLKKNNLYKVKKTVVPVSRN